MCSQLTKVLLPIPTEFRIQGSPRDLALTTLQLRDLLSSTAGQTEAPELSGVHVLPTEHEVHSSVPQHLRTGSPPVPAR